MTFQKTTSESSQYLPLSKQSLDYISTLLDASKNGGFVVVGIAAVIFYLFPSVHIFFRDKIMGESLWYFVGTFYIEKNPKNNTMQEGNFRPHNENIGHYHNFYLPKAAFNPKTGLIQRDTVLMVETAAAVGRAEPSLRSQTKQVSGMYDCIFVLEAKEIQKKPAHGALLEKYIWVRALPNACRN